MKPKQAKYPRRRSAYSTMAEPTERMINDLMLEQDYTYDEAYNALMEYAPDYLTQED